MPTDKEKHVAPTVYDNSCIEILLSGLEPPRKRYPWSDMMYASDDPAQVAALRRMMENYARENPDEDVSDQIVGLTEQHPPAGDT